MRPLQGKVAAIARMTRIAGRGIAMMFGESGATVYVKGRRRKGNLSYMGRAGTIEETAELVTKQDGKGIV